MKIIIMMINVKFLSTRGIVDDKKFNIVNYYNINNIIPLLIITNVYVWEALPVKLLHEAKFTVFKVEDSKNMRTSKRQLPVNQ